MKYLVLLTLCFFSLTTNAQEQEQNNTFEFGYGLRIESASYAPVNGVTLGGPVPIGIGSVKYTPTKTSVFVWKAFDPLQQSGGYNALFVAQPLNKRLTFLYAHFFDFTFDKLGANIIALKASGGEELKWSLKVSDIVFNSRSPRYVLQSNLTYGQFTLNSWNYYESDVLTWTMGVEWRSPQLKISDRWSLNVNAVLNDSITKRFNWSDGFGQSETFSIGLGFSPTKA